MYKLIPSLLGVSKLFDFDDFREADTMLKAALVVCICLFAVLVAGTLIAYFALKAKGRTDVIRTKDITYGAICLAASYALSFLGIGLPNGGTVTFASILPVMIYCYYFGFLRGLVVTVAYTILQFFQGPAIVHPVSPLLDYVIPYLSVIFLGIFSYRQTRYNKTAAAGKHPLAAHVPFFIGMVCYFVLRYVSHAICGVVFWGEWIAWGGWWQSHVWAYSFAYNAAFLVPDTVIALCAAIGLLSSKSFNAFMASSANALQNSDTGAKNYEGTASGADEG